MALRTAWSHSLMHAWPHSLMHACAAVVSMHALLSACFLSPIIQRMLALAEVGEKDTVFDLGCGDG